MKKWSATVSYGLLQVSLWGFYAVIVGYSSNFMYRHGFSDGQISILLGITTGLSCVLQLSLAELIARVRRLTVFRVLLVLGALLLLGAVLMGQEASVPAVAGLALGLTLLQVLPAMGNAIGMDSIAQGSPVDYGAARGMGSGGYSVLSLITGLLVSRLGTGILWILALANGVVFLGSVLWFHHAGEIQGETLPHKQEKGHKGFLRAYPRFALVLLGCVLLSLSHNLVCSFMLQIVTYKGGDASHQGTGVFIAAMTELPVMFAFGWLLKKRSSGFWLGLGAAFFVLKPACLYLAAGVYGIYGAQLTQMVGYAVFVMASAYYAGTVTGPGDMVRVQSYMTSVIPMGSLIANSTGGFLCQWYSPQGMLLVSATAAVLGGITVIAGIRLEQRRKK